MRKKRIIVADDDELILCVMGIEMSACGYEVIPASNGREALDVILEEEMTPNRISLLVTDLDMPVMNGFHLIAEVQKLERDIPIFVVSGFSDPKTKGELSKNGVAGMMEKPVNLKAFLREISKILLA